jgi:hypothetical protein
MNLLELVEILGEEWAQLDIYYIDGIQHFAGCHVIKLLCLSSTTQAIRGNKFKPKLEPPLYIKFYEPSINHRCKVYMLTVEGIIQVIKKNKKCRKQRMLLRINGIKF